MTVNIQALVDAFTTRTNQQDYNIAEDINNLQTVLKTLAYATLAQSDFANTETLAATKTLTDDSPTLQFLNPNSADRDVSLPTLAVTNKPFLIMNTNGSTYLLTVKNAGGTVIRVIPASKMYLFVSDGNQWVCVGFDLYKTLTPSAISANQNDYSPTGNYEADILRISSTAAYSITGLVGGSTNRIKTIKNVGSYSITLSDENASSTAANRFALARDLEVEPDAMVMLVYDPTTSRWGAVGLIPSVTASNTVTFTNKTLKASSNVIEEVATATSAASHTPTGGYLRNRLKVTAQAEAVTFNEPSGTPVDGNMLLIQIKDNGTARAITWNSIFVGEKPTTTTLSKWTYVLSFYNSTAAKWHNVAQWTET